MTFCNSNYDDAILDSNNKMSSILYTNFTFCGNVTIFILIIEIFTNSEAILFYNFEKTIRSFNLSMAIKNNVIILRNKITKVKILKNHSENW